MSAEVWDLPEAERRERLKRALALSASSVPQGIGTQIYR